MPPEFLRTDLSAHSYVNAQIIGIDNSRRTGGLRRIGDLRLTGVLRRTADSKIFCVTDEREWVGDGLPPPTHSRFN